MDRLTINTGRNIVRFMSMDRITGKVYKEVFSKNLVLYGGADILAKLLAGNSNYAISGLYIEYDNAGGTPTPPAFDRSADKSYYDGLISDPNRDYLRVSLAAAPLFTASSSDYDFNRLTFLGISDGTVGVHGKVFSSAANSTVFGAALYCAVDPSDSSQDLIYARTYSTGALAKAAGLSIGVSWLTEIL